jgi:hypothetical protein
MSPKFAEVGIVLHVLFFVTWNMSNKELVGLEGAKTISSEFLNPRNERRASLRLLRVAELEWSASERGAFETVFATWQALF